MHVSSSLAPLALRSSHCLSIPVVRNHISSTFHSQVYPILAPSHPFSQFLHSHLIIGCYPSSSVAALLSNLVSIQIRTNAADNHTSPFTHLLRFLIDTFLLRHFFLFHPHPFRVFVDSFGAFLPTIVLVLVSFNELMNQFICR